MKKFTTYPILLQVMMTILLLLLLKTATAQYGQRLIGSRGNVSISATIPAINDDGYVSVGRHWDNAFLNGAMIMKLDNNGNFQWMKILATNEDDIALRVVKDNDSYYVLQSLLPRNATSEVSVTKLDATGATVWQKKLGDVEDNVPLDLVVNSDGNIWVFAENYNTGSSLPFQTRQFVYFFILNKTTGATISNRKFSNLPLTGTGTPRYCGIQLNDAILGHNNNVMAFCVLDSLSRTPIQLFPNKFMYLMKFNPNGTFHSAMQLSAAESWASGASILKWGNGYALLGHYDDLAGSSMVIMKADSSFSNGFLNWKKRLKLPCNVLRVSATVANNGNLIVAAQSSEILPSSNGSKGRVYLFEIATDGSVVWSKRILTMGLVGSPCTPIQNASGNIILSAPVIPTLNTAPWTGASKAWVAMTDLRGNMGSCFSTTIDKLFSPLGVTVRDNPLVFFGNTTNARDFSVNTIDISSTQFDTCLQQRKPRAAFTLPAATCVGRCINSNNQTEFEPDSYEWTFQPQPDLSALDTSCFPNVLNICFPDTGLFTIQLVATNAFGSDTARHMIRVYDSIPDFTIGQDASICQGDSVVLRRPAFPFGTTWVWTTPMGTYFNIDSVVAKLPGLYRLTATNFCGTKSAEITLNVNSAVITISAGSDIDTCVGSSVTLQANATGTNLNYRWSTGATSLSINVNTPGFYWVEASNECAVKRDSVEVRMLNPSFNNIDLGTDTTLCSGQSILLQGPAPPQAGWTYLWQNGSNTFSLLASAEGDYWLEMYDGECRRRDSVKVFYKDPPSIQLPADIVLCEYDSLKVDISAQLVNGDIVRWNDGADSVVRILKQPGTYWCEVSNRCGVDRDSVIIGQIRTPVYSIGNNAVLCNTASYTIQVSPVLDSVKYLWNTGDTTASITVTNSGQYTVTVSNRCASIPKTVDITFRRTPVIDLPAQDSLLCNGENIQLTASGSGNDNTTTYSWSNGTNGLSVNVSQPGNYVISASNSCGIAKDSVTITYSLLPADLFNTDTFLCDNQTIQLISLINDPSYDYLWSTGAVNGSITINKPGEYNLLIKDGRCSASDTIRAYQCEAGRCLFIPNAFSPNGNGVNETFKPIVVYCRITGYEMFVFDRWGRRVFYSNKLSEGWDGRIANGTLQPGVYVYKLNYYVQTTNNRRIPFVKHGTVTVVL